MQEFFDELFLKQYSQERYDFDINALSPEEIKKVKQLAAEKRAEYGIAPIGWEIFGYIRDKEPALYFESEPFDNKELDALLYLPNPNKDEAFIILNSNQLLLNQIFSTAHEYYHYIQDIDSIRKNPHICSLSQLRGKEEQKASRFAAEFLLPDQALKNNINQWLLLINKKQFKEAGNDEVSALCYALTVRFCMPLKAVMFRLYEEGYIDDIAVYMTNYVFIKQTLMESKTKYAKKATELMSTENPYIEEVMYTLIPKAYLKGYVSLDKIEEDVSVLGMDKTGIMDLLNIGEAYDDDDDMDDSLRTGLLNKLNGMDGL